MSVSDKIHVLIVDDNANNLLSLSSMIEDHMDVHVVTANSGEKALRILLQQNIDLIILDIQMPVMDGFETARMIRARKRTEHVPIIFLTAAYKSDEFQQKGFAIGGTDYLTKPIDNQQLLSRLGIYMRFIARERQYSLLLEQKVKERTAELSEANQHLQEEITHRAQIESQLHWAKEMAETANRAKTQFLANMSHELRTPLNAILGYTEILQEDAEETHNDVLYQDLQKINASSHHLLDLISDILDISKIEAGQVDLDIETVEIAQVLNDVIVNTQPLIEKQGNQFLMVCGDNLPESLQADGTKLRQVLINLLSNSAKFTENGNISLSIALQSGAQSQLQFSVSDTGIGMSSEQIERLFQPFSQGDTSYTRKYGGTGLGLAITKHYVELMQGTITVASTPNEGSTFTVTLPLQMQLMHSTTTTSTHSVAQKLARISNLFPSMLMPAS